MKFDAVRFLKDNNIQYWTAGKNVKEDHVHLQCPFCDDRSNHLGINYKTGSVSCWRCKSGSLPSLVSKLLRIPYAQTESVIEEYSDGVSGIVNRKSESVNRRVSPMTLPGEDLNPRMKDYLTGRGFDADHLIQKYGLRGTAGNSYWEGSNFSWRIIIPVYDPHGRLVSFQARDWTGKSELRYKNASISKSIIDPKDLLYNAHLAHKSRIVVVEGIFDAWRLGDGFVCSFGTSMRQSQISLLSQWKEIVFLYDPEPEAQAHAREYATQLSSVGCKCSVVEADFGLNANGEPRDPGDLTDVEANEIRRELLF